MASIPLYTAGPQVRPARVARAARIVSIDALRGLVMLLMLVDHAREFFFLHMQVSDPMDVADTSPGLFFSRLAAHLCAPVFVALAGISAWLYGAGRSRAAVAGFLVRRGLFLVALELTVVTFAWSFALPPSTFYLQVIWAIGVAMIALAALVRLPRLAVALVGGAIVLGHNLLDPVALAPGGWAHAAWAVLHDRGYIELGHGFRVRTSYPVLPWIGVIALGYAIGPWFARDHALRQRRLYALAAGLLLGFVLLRALNGYGEPVAWQAGATPLETVMSFLNLTKYPPSADFLLLTLGIGAAMLAGLGSGEPGPVARALAVLGGAPLFFYIAHLYLLHIVFHFSGRPEAPSITWIWAIAAASAPPLWLATRWFAGVKRRSGRWWMRYL